MNNFKLSCLFNFLSLSFCWFVHLNIFCGVHRSMVVKASSHPKWKLPLHAKAIAKDMAATSSLVLQRSKWRVRNPYVDDEAEVGQKTIMNVVVQDTMLIWF